MVRVFIKDVWVFGLLVSSGFFFPLYASIPRNIPVAEDIRSFEKALRETQNELQGAQDLYHREFLEDHIKGLCHLVDMYKKLVGPSVTINRHLPFDDARHGIDARRYSPYARNPLSYPNRIPLFIQGARFRVPPRGGDEQVSQRLLSDRSEFAERSSDDEEE